MSRRNLSDGSRSTLGRKPWSRFILVLAVVLGIGFSIGLFFLLPTLLSEFALALDRQ